MQPPGHRRRKARDLPAEWHRPGSGDRGEGGRLFEREVVTSAAGICMAANASHRTGQSRPLVALLLDALRFGTAKA